MATLPQRAPQAGDLVWVRSRQWLVEEVVQPPEGGSPQVSLACADDDAQGQTLTVFWDCELDRRILEEEGWTGLAGDRFDAPRTFAAFYNTLRWNCTTATNPDLFQAPFRAGIQLDAYQMEPLRKALRLPRVNLFIADDTGLGKTIEAGLIARELLLRRKAKRIVVAAPPSVLEQWKMELEDRFGLLFEILDRAYVSRMRRERGFGVNPWRTHTRFLVSHKLLIDPAYADPLREWLGPMLPGSLLILDEAHHAAPSSGGRYGIETKITRAVRDLGGRFEHRLFLSATPHNGHSNSFSTLLELLDPYRFTRGVKVRGKQDLEPVMVRRLKEDIREVHGGFPKRNVQRVVIDDLPEDAPELVLSRLLDEYRGVSALRHADAPPRARTAAGLLVVGLQQRLLSSTEAFARSLRVHIATLQRHREKALAEGRPATAEDQASFLKPADADDENAALDEETAEAAEAGAVENITRAAEAAQTQGAKGDALWEEAQALLSQMRTIAEDARHQPDAKTCALIGWIRANQCPALPPFGKRPTGAAPAWNERRVLIFTENREGTKRYLKAMLEQAIEYTEDAEERIAVIDGLTSGPRRKEVQRRFNAHPKDEPLRILIATDAAREGLNFQAHCTDLFHFDLPWNPGRIEQRNGRIDRKLQSAPEVTCHYFALQQRMEDRVLEVLVHKTETIKRELGSLAKVIDDDVERRLLAGIPHNRVAQLQAGIEQADLPAAAKAATAEELEDARERKQGLEEQIERCRTVLERSRGWVKFDEDAFRDALSCSLEMLNMGPLREHRDAAGRVVWALPPIADPRWVTTLDSLRSPRKLDEKLADWRKQAPIRPVVFKDPDELAADIVHLHLEQRVAQRLLARFQSQGFREHDLTRACLAQTRDSIPRVILLGRLALYGQGAERLHEELVPIAARWRVPSPRRGNLRAYARDAEAKTLTLLDEALGRGAGAPNEVIQRRLLASAATDIEALRPQLERRAKEHAADAVRRLAQRGEREATDITNILQDQRQRVEEELARQDAAFSQRTLDFSPDETRQLEADKQHWQRRLGQFDEDLAREPERIRAFYQVRAQRLTPVGLVYLWPETN